MKRTIIIVAALSLILGGSYALARTGESETCCSVKVPINKVPIKLGFVPLRGNAFVSAAPALLQLGRPVPVVTAGFTPVAGMSTLNRILAGAVSALAYAGVAEESEGSFAWLGVTMSPVPEPLARHLALDEQGIMVMNVVEGSPAEGAGVEQFDVIVSLGGDAVASEFSEFGALVKTYSPGDRVIVGIIRSGEPIKVTVILGESPTDFGSMSYVYETQPRNIIRQHVKGLGKIIQKDDDGNWVVQDLGEMKDFAPLVLSMPQLKGLGRSFEAFGGSGNSNITVRTQDDEGSLAVEFEQDGEDVDILVRRTHDENGVEQIEEKNYTSEDELREEDPEAYELLKGSRGNGFAFRCHFDLDGLNLPELQKEWTVEIQRSLKDNREVWNDAMKTAMEAYQRALPQMENAQQQFLDARDLFKQFEVDRDTFKWHDLRSLQGSARVSITEQPDGEIEVTTRQGDSELIRVYRDEDELRERDPSAYRKYLRLQGASELED